MTEPLSQRYPATGTVRVHPFTRQVEGGEAVIGRLDLATYLVVPLDVLAVIDELAAGRTVGEASAAYRQRHGEEPDLQALLSTLEGKGLVAPAADGAPAEGARPSPKRFSGHFQAIPPSVARALFAPPALFGYALLVAAAAVAVFRDPAIVPGWQALFFPAHLASMVPLLLVLHCGAIFLHEMGHLLAARAAGVPARLGIGHRLWIVVAETDMTGIWSLPRRQRYFPMLAGPLVDVVSAALLVLLLAAQAEGLVRLGELAGMLVPAMLLRYLLGLAWQCYFFVRTDLYYVVASAFGCKNLLTDTETFLRQRVGRLFGRRPATPLDVPPHELRAIRTYSVIWLGGRVVAFSVLVLVQIPLIFNYFRTAFDAVDTADTSSLVAVATTVVTLLVMGLGMAMWVRSLTRKQGETP
jgi:hypothetical protein